MLMPGIIEAQDAAPWPITDDKADQMNYEL
jgi:hypothetical protein